MMYWCGRRSDIRVRFVSEDDQELALDSLQTGLNSALDSTQARGGFDAVMRGGLDSVLNLAVEEASIHSSVLAVEEA